MTTQLRRLLAGGLRGLLLTALALVLLPSAGQAQSSAVSPMAVFQQDLKEKYHLPPGEPLCGGDEDAAIAALMAGGKDRTEVAVTGQSFRRAVQITVAAKTDPYWDVLAAVPTGREVKQGDRIALRFYVRARVPGVAGQTGHIQYSFKNIEPYEPFAESELFPGDTWQQITTSGIIQTGGMVDKAADHYAPGQLQMQFLLGYQAQQVEIGGVTVVDLGNQVPEDALPKPGYVHFTWPGREPNAPWRKAALARIQKIRTAPLTVRVVDRRGRPVAGAQVQVSQTRHAFLFGSDTSMDHWGDAAPSAKDRWHRERMHALFNYATNDGAELMPEPIRSAWFQTFLPTEIAGLKRLKRDGFVLRSGHLVWGVPVQAAKDPDGFDRETIRHMREVAAVIGPHVDACTMFNEFGGSGQGIPGVGYDRLAGWAREARRLLPRARLIINENELYGPSNLHAYLRLAHELQARKAPVDMIGEEGHFWKIIDPRDLLHNWDTLHSATGLPLAITEADVKFGDFGNPQDEGDYFRDVLIAAFSHPAMTEFTMWGFSDDTHWLGDAPLYDKQHRLKPGGRAYLDLVFGRWWTQTAGRTDGRGQYAVRGFQGRYRLTVTAKGLVQTVTIMLPPGGRAVTVRLARTP